MFSQFEKTLLYCGYFDVYSLQDDSAEIMSIDTEHFWIIKKFDKEGYPGTVLYHSHDGERYHVHYCYKEQDAALAISEIMSHDRYQKKKLKLRNKITSMSNKELMLAIC